MSTRGSLVLGLVVASCVVGCHGSTRFGSIHLEKPGTHVVASPGALSVARVTDGGTRVCTRTAPPEHAGKKGKGRGPGGSPASALDTLLFRLCEARSNNDISAEQYAASVQSIVKMMEESRVKAPQSSGWRDGGGPRMQQRPGRFPGRRGPRWNRPAGPPDDKPNDGAPATDTQP